MILNESKTKLAAASPTETDDLLITCTPSISRRPYCRKWWSNVNARRTRREFRTANETASHSFPVLVRVDRARANSRILSRKR